VGGQILYAGLTHNARLHTRLRWLSRQVLVLSLASKAFEILSLRLTGADFHAVSLRLSRRHEIFRIVIEDRNRSFMVRLNREGEFDFDQKMKATYFGLRWTIPQLVHPVYFGGLPGNRTGPDNDEL
jgi:hypothetical protein